VSSDKVSRDQASGGAPDGTARRPRRAVLAGAAGALAVAAAETLAGATPAQATQGSPVMEGQDNTGAASRTGVFTTGNTEFGILADPNTSNKGSIGVYGHGLDIGVLGEAAGLGGNGVIGVGGGGGTGVIGRGGASNGTGVSGVGVGVGVFGESAGSGDGVAGSGGGSPPPTAGITRRSNYGRRVFRPACDGRNEPGNGGPPRIVTVDATTWPGVPLASWPAGAQNGEGRSTPEKYLPPRGRGIRIIPDGVPLASWLPLVPGLTAHGLRHGHRTWMAEDGIPDVLAEQRLGHEVPGMRGLYTHVSDRMREALIQALQARWDDSLRARAAICGHSPIPLLDEMLAPYCRDQADTGTANGTIRHLTTRVTPEVVRIPVRDHDAGERGQDPELAEGFQGAPSQEEQRVPLGDGGQHVLLGPGGPAPQRGLIESGHVGGGDQRLDQFDHIRDHGGCPGQAGVDEAHRDPGAGDVGDQLGASLGGHVLEHREIHRQGAQVRADAHRRSACPFRAGRHMHLAALAAGLVEVMLDAACCHQRHLQLLERPDDTQVRRAGQVRPAPARARRAVIDHLIGFRPRHRRARRPRLLPAAALAAPAAPLPLGRHPSRQVIGRRRHRGVAAVTAQPAPQLRDLGPQLPDRPRQLTDQLIPRRA